MSDERGLIGTIVDNVGDTYQRMLWQDSGITAPQSATPEIEGPVIGAPDIGPPGDMGMDFTPGPDIGPDGGGVGMDFPTGPDIGPPGDMGMDFTPADAPIVAEDYEPQQAAIEAPMDTGSAIEAPDLDNGPEPG